MGFGLRPGAKAPDEPPSPTGYAPPLDSTARHVVERRDVDAGHSCGKLLAVAPVNYLQPKLIRARGARRQQRLLGAAAGASARSPPLRGFNLQAWSAGALDSSRDHRKPDRITSTAMTQTGTLGCGRQPRGLRRRPRLAPGGSGAARDGIGRN